MGIYKRFKRIIYTSLLPMIRIIHLIRWRIYLITSQEIKLIVGSGGTTQVSWFATDIHTLDLTRESDFRKYFKKRKIKKILAEHVLEHLTNQDLELMLKNLSLYCSPECNIRIAVPDGFHRNKNYFEYVKPGGSGEGAADHKNLFNYKTLTDMFSRSGFIANLIEYWDEHGKFYSIYANDENGIVYRSFINDERNADGNPNYTSLIVDFKFSEK